MSTLPEYKSKFFREILKRTAISNRQNLLEHHKNKCDSLIFIGHAIEHGLQKKDLRANGGCLGYPEARKDVVSCEKVRGSANRS